MENQNVETDVEFGEIKPKINREEFRQLFNLKLRRIMVSYGRREKAKV
jgi:hypothetical protein